jgi:FdhD protein
LIRSAADIVSVDAHDSGNGWILRIGLAGGASAPVIERARQRVSESSCGLCGIENLEAAMRPLPQVTARLDLDDAAVFRALDTLYARQPLNRATGAAHAAAFCSASGEITLLREDVGRHNALDKLLGALARQGISPTTGFLLLTARCSYELVQKAVLANCPVLVTISAATTLAVDHAQQHGLTLLCLARPDAFLRMVEGA